MTILSLLVLLPLSAHAAPSSEASFAAAAARVSAQMTAGFAAASWNEEDTLIDLLRDSDPEVRRQAVRSLKNWVYQRSSTRDRVLDVFKSRSEDLAVRREAAKTLSVVSGYSDVQSALLDCAQRGTEPSLRAVSYKALYWSAAQRWDVRDALLEAARRETELSVRRAAIWALFVASGDNRVQDLLDDVARRDRESSVRVEALKSLYGGMGSPRVRDPAYDLARREPEASVRRAAILLNSYRVTSSQKDLLEDIAQRDPDPQARAAAIVALGGQREEILTFFHLVRRDNNGVLVGDPLDAE